ncbi:ribonuclease H-like domain-containing protein [Aspergillus multicolor]|uniref:3'-5' exonuclease n=1 Tax=Aspergillus multicolor TaxID=41759 RepID=UPI003CCD29BE
MKRSFSEQSEPRTPLAEVQGNGDSRNNILQNANTRLPPWKQQTPAASKPAGNAVTQYWSHRLYKTEEGKPIMVHYCSSLATSEKVAQFFINDPVLGFDMEWQAGATTRCSIQENLSTIQLANRNKIALFHIARFRPNLSLDHLVPPTLKAILENPDITKTGVNIRGDCTRLRKYLEINARGSFELSHLHKLLKYCHTTPHLINKYKVKLADQVEEHLGFPLAKELDVRCSNWQKPIGAQQAHYAAADAYAGYQLFMVMEAKRKALKPVPPLPAHDELNLSIRWKEEEEAVDDPGPPSLYGIGIQALKRAKKSSRAKDLQPAVDLDLADIPVFAELKARSFKKRIQTFKYTDDPSFQIVKGAGTPRKRAQPAKSDDDSDFETMESPEHPARRAQSTPSATETELTPVKKRVGRPRKTTPVVDPADVPDAQPVKRKVGRPRKRALSVDAVDDPHVKPVNKPVAARRRSASI